MGRFLCALALCALLSAGALAGGKRDAQPVFFSLLFPQLTLEFRAEDSQEDVCWWEAMFL